MKFLIDAHLPPSLALLLTQAGFDATHTRSLPRKNLTSDHEINLVSVREGRILITKDQDFYHSYLLQGKPHKLLIIRVGNLRKDDLNKLVMEHLETIIDFFNRGSVVELRSSTIKLLL